MSASFSYANILQMMQDWPVNASAQYLADIPAMVQMGESRLLKDLNLDIFDQIDSSFTLLAGNNLIPKPAGLIQLRDMRVALITGTTVTAPSQNALILPITAPTVATSMTLTGVDGPSPATISPAQNITATTLSGGNGINVVITGIDDNGQPQIETIVTSVTSTTTGKLRFSSITDITMSGGASGNSIEVGTAGITLNNLGQSFVVEHRSKSWCDAFNSDPTVTAQPRYYNELNQTFWQVVSSADQNYAAVLWFVRRPQSIVTLGRNWLGDNVGELLFAASLMEAERFLKADDRFDDISTDYQTKLGPTRAELRESIRMGEYSPYKPVAQRAQ